LRILKLKYSVHFDGLWTQVIFETARIMKRWILRENHDRSHVYILIQELDHSYRDKKWEEQPEGSLNVKQSPAVGGRGSGFFRNANLLWNVDRDSAPYHRSEDKQSEDRGNNVQRCSDVLEDRADRISEQTLQNWQN